MTIKPYGVSTEPNPNMSRNVQEMYKNSTDAEIRADLEKTRSEAVQVIINTENDFNVATTIRSHNALNAKELYIVGRRKYDRRGTVGTHHYTTIFSADTVDEVFDKLHAEGYTIYAVDNIMEYNPKNVWDVEFPAKSVFVYGTENQGLTEEVIKKCDDMVYISMYGSVRSFNMACSSSIVLSEYSRQHRFSRRGQNS